MRATHTLIARFVDLRPGESAPVVAMLWFALLLGFAQVYLSSAAISLFLAEFSATMLPWGYIGIAVTMPLIGLAYERLGRVLSLPRLLMTNLALMALSLVAFRYLIDISGRWTLLALYVWFVVVWGMLNLALWGLAGRLFNVRQSKRLFGLIGAGEMLAMVIGGLSVAVLVQPFGAASLLWLSVSFIVLAMLMLRRICVRFADRLQLPERAADEDLAGSDDPPQQRFLALIFASSGIAWLVFYVVDNAFFLLASERYSNEIELATLVGRLEAGVGVLLLFSRLLLTPWLLVRFGVRAGLLAIPVLVGLGALSVVLAGNLGAPLGVLFFLAALTKVLEESCRDSVFRSSLQVLYQPLSPARRLRAQTLTEGIVDPLAAGIASVLLLTLGVWLGFTPVQLFQVLLGLFVIWIITSLTLQPHYVAALRRALARRSGNTVRSRFLEGADSKVLREALHSPHSSEVIYALGLLRETDPAAWRTSLPGLLAHPRSQVRREALIHLAEQPEVADTRRLRQLVRDDVSAAVRGQALYALAALDTDTAVDEVAAYLNDEDEQVCRGAMTGLIRHGGIHGILLAGNQLLQRAASTDPTTRRSAAIAVGEIGSPAFYHPLLPLLADADDSVAEAALQAAARLRSRELWSHVIPLLDRPSLRGHAVDALRQGGRAAAETVARCLRDPRLKLIELTRMVGVLGVIEDPRAVDLLLAQIDEPRRELREQLLQALVRQRPRLQPAQREQLLTQIARERDDALWLLQQLSACQRDRELSLLSPLREQQRALRRRLLLLLQLSHDYDALAQVRDRMDDINADQRAYALELLDNVLTPSLKPALLPLFDSSSRGSSQLLAEIADQPMPLQQRRLMIEQRAEEWSAGWLQASALCALDRHETGADVIERVRSRLQSSCWLVREAAQWWLTLHQRDPGALLEAEIDWQFVGNLRVRLLREVPIFEHASDSALASVAERLHERVYKRGETIIDMGDPCRSIYIIAAGTVGVFRGRHRLASLHAPELFGEFALLDQQPRSASVKAETLSRICELDQASFEDLLFDQPDIARRLIRLMAERLRNQALPSASASASIPESDAETAALDPLAQRLLLRSLPLFAQLPEVLIAELAESLQRCSYSAGEVIYRRGERGTQLFIVVSGVVALSRDDETPAVLRGSRQLFGDLAPIDARPRETTAIAQTDCVLLRLEKQLLQDLLPLWPQLSRSMLRDLAVRNRIAMGDSG